MQRSVTPAILLILIMLAGCQPAVETPGVAFEVENAWVRAMPPGRRMTAAYGVFKNSGPDELRINGFSSPQFSSVSLHETIIDSSGMSHMQEIPEMILQPGEVMVLEPGAKHLMLMGRQEKQDPVGSDSVTITFELDEPVSVGFILK